MTWVLRTDSSVPLTWWKDHGGSGNPHTITSSVKHLLWGWCGLVEEPEGTADLSLLMTWLLTAAQLKRREGKREIRISTKLSQNCLVYMFYLPAVCIRRGCYRSLEFTLFLFFLIIFDILNLFTLLERLMACLPNDFSLYNDNKASWILNQNAGT